jgi:hypothetical protein
VTPDENVDLLRREFDRWQAAGARVEAIPAELDTEDVEWDISAYPLVDLETRGRGRDNLLRVWTVHGGRISKWRLFETRDEALEAVGVRQ